MQKKDRKKHKTYKVLITGGHLTPAIAVIEHLRKQHNQWEVVFIGRKSATERSSAPSKESLEIPKWGIPFYSIQAGKIPRHVNLETVTASLKIPIGITQAFLKVRNIQPDVVLSFGGYVAVPVAIAAKILRIPIVTHEQTTAKGLGTALIEHLAAKIAISWDISKKDFRHKVVLTGNPIRETFFAKNHKISSLPSPTLPTIYITGGNLGSQAINLAVLNALKVLTKHFMIIHQSGTGKAGADSKQLTLLREELPINQQNNYLVRPWFEDIEVAWLMRHARLIVSRAGANSITEIALSGTPAILIPLPKAGRNEQLWNAQMLKDTGIAEILPQDSLEQRFSAQAD